MHQSNDASIGPNLPIRPAHGRTATLLAARRPARIQLYPPQQPALRPSLHQLPLEARQLGHEPVVGRRGWSRVANRLESLLQRPPFRGHDVRGADGGAPALTREAVHQHPAPVQQALGDELEAPIEVDAQSFLRHVFHVDALVLELGGKLGLEAAGDGEDVGDVQAL